MVGLGMVRQQPEDVTVDKLKSLFPSKKAAITQETADIINLVQKDPEFDGHKLLNNLVSLQAVMTKNSSSMNEYIDAIRFCAYIEAGETLIESYKRTFAYRDFVQERLDVPSGSTEYKELSSAATRYRKSPIVVDILTQANVPLYLMFQGTTYEAVIVLSKEMHDAAHAKDRIAAAKAILEHVKPPENVKIELDVGVKENSAVQNLQDQLAKFAKSTTVHLEAGSATLGDLGAMQPEDTIDVEVDDEL